MTVVQETRALEPGELGAETGADVSVMAGTSAHYASDGHRAAVVPGNAIQMTGFK
jgi:hypothetical protein